MAEIDIREIFQAGLDAVAPPKLIAAYLRDTGGKLRVHSTILPNRNLYVVGIGKAALPMLNGLCQSSIGEHIAGGLALCPAGQWQFLSESCPMLVRDIGENITVLGASPHNLPDKAALAATDRLIDFLQQLPPAALLVFCISGGGSALLCKPKSSLADMQTTTRLLAARGATIQELNMLRTCLSQVKGGRLRRYIPTHTADSVALILSDVVGDDLATIASGPTVDSTCRNADALAVWQKYLPLSEMPTAVHETLSRADDPSPAFTAHVDNVLVGSNRTALDAMCRRAHALNYRVCELTSTLQGDAGQVGEAYANLVREIDDKSLLKKSPHHHLSTLCRAQPLPNWLASAERVCLLAGGETTVQLRGAGGVGGRNQEMALVFACERHRAQSATIGDGYFLSAGTDGQDGPTDAAGAIVPIGADFLIADYRASRAQSSLAKNDSYNFWAGLDEGHWHLKTGYTGTNVMDVQILTVVQRLAST